MISHIVESCPDDQATLAERLDTLARGGARIVSVIWQPQRVDGGQSAAFQATGSFVIVAESEIELPLRQDARSIGDETIIAEAVPLA